MPIRVPPSLPPEAVVPPPEEEELHEPPQAARPSAASAHAATIRIPFSDPHPLPPRQRGGEPLALRGIARRRPGSVCRSEPLGDLGADPPDQIDGRLAQRVEVLGSVCRPRTLTQSVPSTYSKANPFGACSIRKTMKAGEKSSWNQMSSRPGAA